MLEQTTKYSPNHNSRIDNLAKLTAVLIFELFFMLEVLFVRILPTHLI